jgi:hypothetical protein
MVVTTVVLPEKDALVALERDSANEHFDMGQLGQLDSFQLLSMVR